MNENFERYQSMADEVIESCPPHPRARYAGRGIVICAGGAKYFTCGWVCATLLRHVGCELPIEFWYLGDYEMNDEMAALVAPLGVTCVDGHAVREQYPVRRLHGWELKPYAVLHSSFEEVLFLDADNVPLVDPSFLFDTAPYQEHGALFWPDYGPIPRHNSVWELCGVPYRFEPSFETGQMLIDKRRCWKALLLTMHYNEHSDEYYKHTGGDKDTFHMAWRRLEQDYGMTPFAVRDLGRRVMCQHDFEGRRIFQHRNLAKWTLPVERNPRVQGFQLEDECFAALEQLEARWCGQVTIPLPEHPGARELEREIIEIERFVYHRVGHDKRELQLLPDQTIGAGRAGLEKNWHIGLGDGALAVCITADHRLTCALFRDERGFFVGRWTSFERMPIELIPMHLASPEMVASLETQRLREYFMQNTFIAIHPRVDQMLLEFGRDEVRSSQPSSYKSWRAQVIGDRRIITLEGDGGHVVHLAEDPDRVWRSLAQDGKLPLHLIPIPATFERTGP